MITIRKVSKTLKGNIRSDRENNFQWNRVSGSLSPKYQRSWGKSSKEKNGNSLVFCQTRRGGTPEPNLFRFFPKGNFFIPLKWSTCSETWKKTINFFFHYDPPLNPLPKRIWTEKPYFGRLIGKKQAKTPRAQAKM